MNDPLVSIILPCYNSERFLPQVLDSVRAQTYSNWELVAVNDLSSDGTAKLLSAAAASDSRIRHIDRATRGGRPGVTKNTGLQHARGEFIAFLDHDDLYLPRKIEQQVALLQRNPQCVAAFHDLVFINSEGRPGSRYLPKLLQDAESFIEASKDHDHVFSEQFFVFQSLRYAGFHTITTMLAPQRMRGTPLDFDPQYSICDDTDLWIRCGLAGPVVYQDEVHAQYRLHDTNLTTNELKVSSDIVLLIQNNRLRIASRLTPEQATALDLRLANALRDLGWAHRKLGQHRLAVSAYWESIRLRPRWQTLLEGTKAALPVKE